ncbi:MAG: hypothetical protein CMN30_24000 [Sandaracinus sp.]|nr:hypothetical protein [Sandaracinus sp.]
MSLRAPATFAVLGALLLVAGAALIALAGQPVVRQVALLFGAQLLAAGLFTIRKRRGVPRMHPVGFHDSGVGLAWAAGGALPTTWLALLVVPTGALMMVYETHAVGFVGPVVVALFVLGLAVRLGTLERKNVRYLSQLLAAEPGGEGRWGSVEGVLRSGGVERIRDHEAHQSTQTRQYVDTTRVGRDGRAEVRTETTTTTTYSYDEHSTGGALALEASGGPVVVESDGAVWGTSRAQVVGLQRTEWTETGDVVLAAGDLRGGRMKATGPESVLAFSAPTDPRGVARGRLRGHRATLAALVLLGLGAGALGAWDVARFVP